MHIFEEQVKKIYALISVIQPESEFLSEQNKYFYKETKTLMETHLNDLVTLTMDY
ncbi:hypothetical protein AB837_00482 [bacterium AB1]|nr:hypothetical protein AB837_00482 [bacterium AB1]